MKSTRNAVWTWGGGGVPGSPAAKYFLLEWRVLKRVLKSLVGTSFKKTWNAKGGELLNWAWCLCSTAFMMFSTAKNVLGPTEQPKSAI